MGQRIHDFSQETVEDIQKTLQRSIEEDEQHRLLEWWGDSWLDLTDELGISHYLADVESYRQEVKGRHETALEEFDKLLERVHTIDKEYAARMQILLKRMEAFRLRIIQTAALLAPEALSMSGEEYTALAMKIRRNYAETVKNLNQEMMQVSEEGPKNYQEYWNQSDAYFCPYWWQNEEKRKAAIQWLKEEAKATGGISANRLLTNAEKYEENLNRLHAIQAITNAERSDAYDDQTLNALQNALGVGGIDYNEKNNHTLTEKDFEFLEE